MAELRTLDAVPDARHFSYKVPGLISWAILALTLFGYLLAPDVVIVAARAIGIYLLFRVLLIIAFYFVGRMRVTRCEARARSAAGSDPPPAEVRHVVILPNYKEPVDTLSRTLRALARQVNARQQIIVVLAMEESEEGAPVKGEELRRQFEDQFAHILVTLHPAGLPGELAGKGANQNWAARQARAELVDRMGLSLDHLTVTSCDADSVLHPFYFAELTRQFSTDSQRHRRFWQAPLRYDNNTWRVPAVLRLATYFTNMIQVSELADPLVLNFPMSTYSLSFRLADTAGYWDPAMISEDWHMFLRCMFAVGGQISLVPIFLPISADAVEGSTFWGLLASSYQQRLRHAWGAQDAGYILQQWRRRPRISSGRKGLFLTKVLHDHIIFSTAGMVATAGWLAGLVAAGASGLLHAPGGILGALVQWGNVLNGVGMATIGVVEHLRCRKHAAGWRHASAWGDLLTAPLLPIIVLGTYGLPILHAQTKLLFGSPLAYIATPKKAAEPDG